MSEEERVAVATEDRSFTEILKSLVGQTVTIVNPESFEAAPVGYQLKTGFYKAKVSNLGKDFMVLVTELKKVGKAAGTEPVKQFLPIDKIKRISILKSEKLIHI